MGKLGKKLRNAFKNTGKKIVDGFTQLGKGIRDVFKDGYKTIVTAFKGIKNPWFTIKSLIKGILKVVANFYRSLTDGIIDIVFGITGLIPSIFGEKAGSWWVENLSEGVRHIKDIFLEAPMTFIQGILDFIFGFLEGLGFLITGRLNKSGNRFLNSVKNFGSIIYELVLLVFFKLAFAVQVLFKREDAGDYLVNLLQDDEIKIIYRLFEHSLNLTNVRYKTGFAGVLSRGSAEPNDATTIANTIYFRDSMAETVNATGVSSIVVDMPRVLHELVHVWQFQNGGTDYVTRAMRADRREGDDKYNWWEDLNRETPNPWENLTVEKQGEIIEDAHEAGAFDLSAADFLKVGTLPEPDNYTKTIKDFNDYLLDAVQKIRRGIGAV